MPDESYSLKKAMNFIVEEPSIILPFIFGFIILAVFTVLVEASEFDIIAVYLKSGIPLYGFYLFLVSLVSNTIINFFLVLAIYWQTFSASDLVEKGSFSTRVSLSDALASKGEIFLIAIFIAFIFLIFGYIPFVGVYIQALFTIIAYVSVILLNLNKKGLIHNMTEITYTLSDYYKREPTSALFIGLLMLVYIVPNALLETLVIFVMVIYGSIVLKLLN
ncbi:MAG: hypothetical protein ACYCSO_01025 [Cuniculiplasma sp.]